MVPFWAGRRVRTVSPATGRNREPKQGLNSAKVTHQGAAGPGLPPGFQAPLLPGLSGEEGRMYVWFQVVRAGTLEPSGLPTLTVFHGNLTAFGCKGSKHKPAR